MVLTFLFTDFYGQQKIKAKLEYEKKTFVYKTVGQDSIKADFYGISKSGITKPVIVWIHGGALIFGSRNDLLKEQMEFYLSAGYSILSIDYRLAPETKLPEIIEDIKDAIVWVQNNGALFQIDPKRIFVVGHSAGGYLALMTGFILKIPPRGIVSFYGYGDIQSKWYSHPDSFYVSLGLVPKEKAYKKIHDKVITNASFDDRFDLYLYCRQNGLWTNIVSGHDVIKEPEYFNQFCPVKNINNKFPSVLLIHGDKDTDVPFEQSILMDQALSHNGIDHQFIRMAGCGHVFDYFEGCLGNADIYKAFNEVIKFLDKH